MKVELPEDVRLTMQSILDGTAENPVDGIAYLADELVVLAQNLGGQYTPREALVAHLQGYRQRIENALVSNRQRRDGDKIVGSAWLRIDGDELTLLDDLILGRPPTYWLHYAWGSMTDEAKSGAVADAVNLLLTAGFRPHHSLVGLLSPMVHYNTTIGQIRVYRGDGREPDTDGQDQPEDNDDAEAEPEPWTDGIAADIRLDLPARLDTPATRAVDAAIESAQRRSFAEIQAGISAGYQFDDESWSAVRDAWNPNPIYLDPAIFAAFQAQRLASAEQLAYNLARLPLVVEDTLAHSDVPPPPPTVDRGNT